MCIKDLSFGKASLMPHYVSAVGLRSPGFKSQKTGLQRARIHSALRTLGEQEMQLSHPETTKAVATVLKRDC